MTFVLGSNTYTLRGNVTSDTIALLSDIQTSSGITSVSLASGTNNGTLKLTVDGSTTDNIAVKGLGSMAYASTSSYLSVGGGTISGTLDMNGNIIAGVTNITNTVTGYSLSAFGSITISAYGNLDLSASQGKVNVNSSKFKINGSGTGGILLATTNSSVTDYTATLQAGSGTIAYLSDIPTG